MTGLLPLSIFAASIVCSLLLIHAVLLAWGAWRHSPTYDEVGHLPAGISHWQLGRFELYCVNPPLTRLVAAAPVVLLDPKTDWHGWSDDPTSRSEFRIGKSFIDLNGERAFWYFTVARWACIPFSLLGALVCFCCARRLYGSVAGLLALALWCVSPNILAHGQQITPDTTAAATGTLAAFMFWKWLRKPGWRRAVIAGLALGLAELSKSTWVLLFGLWPLLWLVWQLTRPQPDQSAQAQPVRRQSAAWRWLSQAVQLCAINLSYEPGIRLQRKSACVE